MPAGSRRKNENLMSPGACRWFEPTRLPAQTTLSHSQTTLPRDRHTVERSDLRTRQQRTQYLSTGSTIQRSPRTDHNSQIHANYILGTSRAPTGFGDQRGVRGTPLEWTPTWGWEPGSRPLPRLRLPSRLVSPLAKSSMDAAIDNPSSGSHGLAPRRPSLGALSTSVWMPGSCL